MASREESKTNLSPSWLFNAAMLSDPVDLSQLVTMSRDDPECLLDDMPLLNKMVDKVLNAKLNAKRFDKDARLDVLTILANLANQDASAKEKIRDVIQGCGDWFERYMEQNEASPCKLGSVDEPELYKAMLLLLSRAFNYELRTEDLLELTGGDRRLALEAVVGLLEDGEVIMTEITQRAAPAVGQRGQWEQKLSVVRHEKPLVEQMCRLLLGFTRPDTYFASLEDGFYFMEAGLELPEYTIEKFSVEVDDLLRLTLTTKLIEKLAVAINKCLFSTGRVLESSEHSAIIAVHGFLQNLYLYASEYTEEFRSYVLADTLLVPHVVVPYLERCVYHAAIMSRRARANRDALGLGVELEELAMEVSELSLDYPELCEGMEATLRTLVLCSFRAPRTRLMFQLLHRFNPTASLLRMKSFVARHDYLFSLLLLLNVNMGAFDPVLRGGDGGDGGEEEGECFLAYTLLEEVHSVYRMMGEDGQRRVLRRVEMSGALPVARDTPSYQALLGVLWGGAGSQFDYLLTQQQQQQSPRSTQKDFFGEEEDDVTGGFGETVAFRAARSQAKAEAAARVERHWQEKELDEMVARDMEMGPGELEDDDNDGRNPFADTLRGAFAELDDDLEMLDGLVAADLAACQSELARLEEEVRCLQQGNDLLADSSSEEEEISPELEINDDDDDDDEKKTSPSKALPVEASMDSDGESNPHSTRDQQRLAEPKLVEQQSQHRRRQRKRSVKREDSGGGGGVRRSLLGELPSLEGRKLNEADLKGFLDLKLEMPQKPTQGKSHMGFLRGARGALLSPKSCKKVSSGVPEEFACRINGHLMKDPVVTPQGNHFERATIELWLQKQGSVCPITGEPLSAADLTADEALRKKIMKYHIQKTFAKQNQAVPPTREAKAPVDDLLAMAEEALAPSSTATSTKPSACALDDDLYDF